jgi:hypothetical protein
VSRKKYKSLIDGQDVYEQIRIIPEHVTRSTVTTPDGNMVSNMIQQGDCNVPATYQALMNHLFWEYIGKFMDVYLDDIIVYSDTLEEHIEHIKKILAILDREKLYLRSCSSCVMRLRSSAGWSERMAFIWILPRLIRSWPGRSPPTAPCVKASLDPLDTWPTISTAFGYRSVCSQRRLWTVCLSVDTY